MRIEIRFEVHGAKDEVEAHETLLHVMGTAVAAINNQLAGEASRIRVSAAKQT